MHWFRPKPPMFHALVLFVCCLASVVEGQAPAVPLPPDCNQDFPNFYSTATSCEMAKTVCLEGTSNSCVSDLVRELGKMTDRCGTQGTQALILRQEITEMILNASLQVDGFLSEVDSEAGHIHTVSDALAERRDRAVNRSTFGAAIGTAGGAVGSALNLGDAALNIAGNSVNATFGGLGAVFAFLGYFQQNGPMGCFPDLRNDPGKKEAKNQCPKLEKSQTSAPEMACTPWPQDQPCNSESPPRGCSPRMLYAFAFPECNQEAGFHSSYDDLINRYLDSAPPGRIHTRRETLMLIWGLDRAQLQQRQELFTSNAEPRKLSIDELHDRSDKLNDLRWRVALMHRDLGQLTHDLAIALRCP